MSQKTLNLCLERYNFVKFGETTKSSHTVLCINNAHSVNSDKYRLTPTAIASKHGEGYVFTLNYDFDRPLFTIVQKSYALDGTSGNIVFEGIDPISKGGSKYLRKVTVSPVKLSDGSYLLEVTKDEYLRIGTTGAVLGDEDLESLNEKIVTMGGIEKSVETVGGRQVLKLDASGSAGAKEIVYFDVDPSNPPSGIYEAIGEALSNNKLPAIRSDGKLYQYTSTATDRYVFVGVFSNDGVGYETFNVYTDDYVQADEHNAGLGYAALPAGGVDEEEPAWAKVCELDLASLNGYSTYGLALLFSSENNVRRGESVESGLFVVDVGSYPRAPSNSCNASWMAYTPCSHEYSKILGIKLICKYGVPSNPVNIPYPLYKIEVWVKYYGNNILVTALQDTRYSYNYGVAQGFYHFPENHLATLQLTEPSYEDTEEYVYKNFFYPAKSPSVTALKSFMITPRSDWLAFDGTNNLVFGSVFSTAYEEVAGDKIRMIIRDGETKYCIEVAKLGVYKLIGTIHVKWTGTPINKIGSIYGYEIDFSKNFNIKRIGTLPALVQITSSAQDFYKLSAPIAASAIDAPIGVEVSMSFQIQYLGNVEG